MRKRSQGGLLSGEREPAEWLAMACPACVHTELTQSSLLILGTLPVGDKRRERKLETNKTDFFFSFFFFFLSAQSTCTVEKRDSFVLQCFGLISFFFSFFFNYESLLNFPRHSVLLPNTGHGGVASGRAAGRIDLRGFRFSECCILCGEPLLVLEMLQSRQAASRSKKVVLQSTSPLFYGVRVLWGNKKKKSVVLTVQQQYAEDREGRTCSMNARNCEANRMTRFCDQFILPHMLLSSESRSLAG